MRIVLVSDTHLSSRDTLLIDNWAAVEQWIASQSPDLVIHLGDITADGVHDASELTRAHSVLTRSGAKTLFLPGNHDIGDHDAGPGEPTPEPLDLERLEQYRKLFGPDRWSLKADGWLLLGINAPLLATNLEEEDAQYQWLEEMLKDNSDPVGLFLHKPLFRDGCSEEIVHTRYVPAGARARLLSLFAAQDLRFVAAGHTHQVRQITVSGVDHVWVPSTAFTVPDMRQERIGEKLVGAMFLEISSTTQAFTHIIPAGMRAHDLLEFTHVYPALMWPQDKGT